MQAQVADLIAQFVNDEDVDERAQKESILGELASRVLNRYHFEFTLHGLTIKSAIHSTHSVEPEFLIDEIKRHIILNTGSNRKAVEFDMAAQRFLLDVPHLPYLFAT